jgi:two-component system alkaline phosphatase synthesis response regulator PhoP
MARILLVEDNLEILRLLQLLLQAEGFTVEAVEDAGIACDLLKEQAPDLLITDLVMPRVGGLDLIRWARRTPALADLPIIALSAYERTYHKAARMAGADVVLEKPDGFGELAEAIRGLLADRKPARPAA